MKNVLIITSGFSPNIGGLETHLDDLCRYLSKNGHKVLVVTYQPLITKTKGPKVERNGNLEIHRIKWPGHWFYKLEAYPPLLFLYMFPGLFIGSLRLLLRHRKEVDVIHAHGIIPALATKILVKIFKKRSVISTHTIYGLKEQPILSKAIEWILSSFDAILPLAQMSRDELVAIGLPDERIRIYTHWVDLDKFKPLEQNKCKAELNLEGKFVALFLSRLAENKGVNALLEAALKVNHEVTFVFVGDGPLAGRVKEEAKVRQNVKLFNQVPNEETPKYYNAADVFVIPSQYEEPFGRVVAEALACGIPVIASNWGTLPQIVKPSVGIVIEPSAENIAQTINSLRENQEQLLMMRANCRAYAVEHFSERNAEIILNAYRGEDSHA